MPSTTGCAKILGTISLGLLTVASLMKKLMQGSLATTSFITVPAVVAITPNSDANHPLILIRERINYLTTVCGVVSASSFTYAFLVGAKHGYLVYSGVLSAVLLRNQQETLLHIGYWLHEKYQIAREFTEEYYAKKTGHRISQSKGKSKEPRHRPKDKSQNVPLQQVASALEQVGAASLANCLVSGIAFVMASIGVLGDVL
jgi:hypothetical protein